MSTAEFVRPRFLAGVELASVNYARRSFPVHTHDAFVIGAIVRGAERLDVRKRSHFVAQGEVLRLSPHEPHANQSVGEQPLCYRVFYISEPALRAFVAEDCRLHFDAPTLSDRRLGASIAALHRRLCAGGTGRLEQESAMASLATMIVSDSRDDVVAPQFNNVAVERARAFIEAYFREDFGLDVLAKIAGLSIFRLSHLFKECIGLSPIAYRNQCRVYEARRLLLRDQSIADIAAELGFADQSHLTRQFQRIIGTSPNRYRQQ